nr:lamin tail domain-containing protein [Parabacteroides goldsteinii]
MKQFILIILVLLPVCVFAQFAETFDGPEITSSNQWKGDLNDFVISDDGWLQLIGDSEKKSSELKIPLSFADNMEWTFDVKMAFKPSDQNHIRFYLLTDKYTLPGGLVDEFYVQIGSTKKTITLRRLRETEKSPKRVIEKELDILKQESVLLSIKVTLENRKLWSLYVRNVGMDTYTLLGTYEQHLSSRIKSIESRVACFYSKKVRGHFIDNLNITSPDDIPVDPEPENPPVETALPTLLDIMPLSLSELQFTFDLPVDISNAQFSITGIGNATSISYVNTEMVVKTVFPKEMTPGENYTISYNGLTDLNGNKMDAYSQDFTLEDDEEENIPPSILINEVMAKPGDGPLFEYVELYNPTDLIFSLNELELWNGNKHKTLPDVVLPPHEYALLYNDTIDYSGEGVAIPIEKFYALNDGGKKLVLKSSDGAIIDEYEYPKATLAKSWERSDSGDWHLSSDPRGGTPGSVNSSGVEEPDKPNKPEEPVEPDKPNNPDEPSIIVEPGEFIFNELLPNPFAGGAEYIELYNRSDRSLPVSGLSVAVRKTDGTLNTRYPLSSVTSMIEPDGYALLTKNLSGVTDFYMIQSPSSLFEIPKLPILANTSSTLVLFRTKDETVIDEVSYSSKWHAPSVKDQKGVALERIDPEAETQSAANWTSASATAGYGTPGYRNSQSDASSPDEPDKPTGIEAPEWVPGSEHYKITYYLDQPGYSCRAFVFNIAGQRVAEIANHELLGLSGELTWDGSSSVGRKLPTGVYIFYVELYHVSGQMKTYKKVFLAK